MKASTAMVKTVAVTMSSTVVASPDAISCDLKGEAIVLHLSSGVYFGLEGGGAHIWEILRVPCTVDQVAAKLISRFDVDEALCRDRTLAFIQQLARHDLVVEGGRAEAS